MCPAVMAAENFSKPTIKLVKTLVLVITCREMCGFSQIGAPGAVVAVCGYRKTSSKQCCLRVNRETPGAMFLTACFCL